MQLKGPPMTVASLLRPGEMLGGFRIDDVIGIGGMAIVYRAEQVSLGRPVALKVLSSKLTSDTVFRERFRREGKHAATLEHPHIVPVHDSGEEDGHLYLAMRLIEGTNLAEMIQTRGLTADQTVELLRPIASALDTAHAAGLIHRDVKPQNILITSQGHPYLADFGVAKGSNTEGLTATGGFVGSVNYASPEQINGLTLTPASDIYALTAVLYQCLTGQVPYPRETDVGVMQAHLTQPPPTLPSRSGANGDFHTILARGMAKDAGSRYGHAGDLINAAAVSVGRLPDRIRGAVPTFPPGEPSPTNNDEGPSGSNGALSGDQQGAASAARPVRSGETEVVARGEPAQLRDAAAGTSVDRRWTSPPDPVPATNPRRRWRPAPLAVGAAIAVVAVVLVVVLLTGSSGPQQASALTSGHLSLRVPSGWRRKAPPTAGLALDRPISISRAGIDVNAGVITSPGPVAGAIPATLIAHYGKPAQAHLAHLPLGPARSFAWRSTSLGALSLYVISTGSGELALSCRAPTSAAPAKLLAQCAALAGEARTIDADVEYPGADPTLARKLAASFSPLRRMAARERRNSPLPSRAAALAGIAAADAKAASELAGSSVPARYRAAVAALAASLQRESSAVRSVAQAARADDRSRYATRRRLLGGAGRSIEDAVRGLNARGFALPRAGVVAPPAGPPRQPRPHLTSAAARPTTPSTSSLSPSVIPSSEAQTTPVAPAPSYTPPARAPQHKSQSAPQTIISAPN
jgi:serine/threonine protein kinase